MARYTRGFSHFVTSMTPPVGSGWSDGRVGLAPTGKAPPYHGAHPKRTFVVLQIQRNRVCESADLLYSHQPAIRRSSIREEYSCRSVGGCWTGTSVTTVNFSYGRIFSNVSAKITSICSTITPETQILQGSVPRSRLIIICRKPLIAIMLEIVFRVHDGLQPAGGRHGFD